MPSSIEMMGYLLTQVGPIVDHFIAGDLLAGAFIEFVFAVLEHFAAGGVEGDADLAAGFVAGGVDGLEEGLDGLFITLDIRGEAAFVADVGAITFFLQYGF